MNVCVCVCTTLLLSVSSGNKLCSGQDLNAISREIRRGYLAHEGQMRQGVRWGRRPWFSDGALGEYVEGVGIDHSSDDGKRGKRLG